MFYWFFESRQDPASDPLVIWLEGGPGCSGELQLLLGNGPFLTNGTKEPVFNQYSWNSHANVMYVDQPGGTGFSYLDNPDDYATNETQISHDLWNMMLKFYEMHPKYADLDLYVFGASYAGHYVPAMSRAILESNSVHAKNFKGMGIGNGWSNPLLQYSQYASFFLSVGLIDNKTAEQANEMYPKCKELIESGQDDKANTYCQSTVMFLLNAAEKKLGRQINPTNYKQICKGDCIDTKDVENFLAREDIIEELEVKGHDWVECSQKVFNHLTKDEMLSFAAAVSMILEQGKQVLIYTGKLGLICNYFGVRDWTNATKWSGQMQFRAAPYKDWIVDGVKAGEVRAYKNFIELEVENGSHQVTNSVPKQALDLFDRFINGKPFSD